MVIMLDAVGIIWTIASLTLAVTGNTFVIFATWKFNAIKLDKLSVWIVQLLAAADIGNSIFILLPVTIVLFHGWVFGDTFCKVSFAYKYIFTVANIILINFFSLNKVYRCVAPLHHHKTGREKLVVIISTIVGSLILPFYQLYSTYIRKSTDIVYSHAQCMCWGKYNNNADLVDTFAGYIIASCLNAIPCLMLVVTNAFLSIFATVKAKSRINKMNIVIVVVVTVLFLLSMLPYFIYYVLFGDSWTDGDEVRFMTFSMFLSSFCNPIVYFATNDHFRRFTISFCKSSGTKVAPFSNSNGSIMRH